MRKRILMISNVYPPNFIGGYELAAREVSEYLADVGCEVEVITSDYLVNNSGEHERIRVSRSLQCTSLTPRTFRTNSFDKYVNQWNLRQISMKIVEFKPDLIILWNLQMLGAPGIIKFIEAINVPAYLYLMDNVFSEFEADSEIGAWFEETYGKLSLPKNIRVVSMSQHLVKEVNDKTNLQLKEFITIPGWIIEKPNFKKNSLNELNRSDNFRFIFSSRIAPHKGIYLVLEAAELLVSRGITNFRVDLYGLGELVSFMYQVEARNMEKYFTYKGLYKKEEAVDVFSNYDSLVFPTWERESFGFVAVEAAASGCVPIITQEIGAGEWLKHSYDSIKISRDVESLAEAMIFLMSIPSGQLDELKSNGRKLRESILNFEHWMKFFYEDIMTFINRSNVGTPKGALKIERAFAYLGMDSFQVNDLTESRLTYSKAMAIYAKLPHLVQRLIRKIANLL